MVVPSKTLLLPFPVGNSGNEDHKIAEVPGETGGTDKTRKPFAAAFGNALQTRQASTKPHANKSKPHTDALDDKPEPTQKADLPETNDSSSPNVSPKETASTGYKTQDVQKEKAVSTTAILTVTVTIPVTGAAVSTAANSAAVLPTVVANAPLVAAETPLSFAAVTNGISNRNADGRFRATCYSTARPLRPECTGSRFVGANACGGDRKSGSGCRVRSVCRISLPLRLPRLSVCRILFRQLRRRSPCCRKTLPITRHGRQLPRSSPAILWTRASPLTRRCRE